MKFAFYSSIKDRLKLNKSFDVISMEKLIGPGMFGDELADRLDLTRVVASWRNHTDDLADHEETDWSWGSVPTSWLRREFMFRQAGRPETSVEEMAADELASQAFPADV